MEQVSKNACEGAVLLKEQSAYVAGACCLTRLHLLHTERDHGFSVEVERKGERASVFVGSDPEVAVAFFLLVAHGEVTPITLEDVWEDFSFSYSQKNTKNPLLFKNLVV